MKSSIIYLSLFSFFTFLSATAQNRNLPVDTLVVTNHKTTINELIPAMAKGGGAHERKRSHS